MDVGTIVVQPSQTQISLDGSGGGGGGGAAGGGKCFIGGSLLFSQHIFGKGKRQSLDNVTALMEYRRHVDTVELF